MGRIRDTEVYTFVHKDGREMECTRHEFMKITGCSEPAVSRVIRQQWLGVTCYGWKVVIRPLKNTEAK